MSAAPSIDLPLATAEAWRALGAHRLRSALTMLGIVIGIAAVVLMLALGEAMQRFVALQMLELGGDQLIVLPAEEPAAAEAGPAAARGAAAAASTRRVLTLADAQALEALPAVRAAAPLRHLLLEVVHAGGGAPATVVASSERLFRVGRWPLAAGSVFSHHDVATAQRVLVIGEQVAATRFAGREAVGQTLRVAGLPFTVIGVLRGSGRALDGTDLGQVLIAPHTALPALPGPRPGAVQAIRVAARGPAARARVEVAQALRERAVAAVSAAPIAGAAPTAGADAASPATAAAASGTFASAAAASGTAASGSAASGNAASAAATSAAATSAAGAAPSAAAAPPAPDDFRIVDLAQVAEASTGLADALATGLGVLAGVSLLVGGVGIMNIMLAGVSERLREIGIRLAIGATPAQVRTQFLAEAVLISLLGGAGGLALAAAAASAIGALGWAVVELTPLHAAAAVAFASAVGIVFGWWPAHRASRLPPVQCLRQ
jgi:putative ABC transport system permease protein